MTLPGDLPGGYLVLVDVDHGIYLEGEYLGTFPSDILKDIFWVVVGLGNLFLVEDNAACSISNPFYLAGVPYFPPVVELLVGGKMSGNLTPVVYLPGYASVASWQQ